MGSHNLMFPHPNKIWSNVGTLAFFTSFKLVGYFIALFKKYCLGDYCRDAILIQNVMLASNEQWWGTFFPKNMEVEK